MDAQAHVEAETMLRIAASQAEVCAGRHQRDSARKCHAGPSAGTSCAGSGILLQLRHSEPGGSQWPDGMRDLWPANGEHVICSSFAGGLGDWGPHAAHPCDKERPILNCNCVHAGHL